MEDKHIEYHYKSKTSETVIVFIHGIQGSPSQFDYLIQMLNGSYSIENLLLPGHGKTVNDFKKSSMTQWQNYVDERVKQLQNEYKSIVLVGHSMGCLLSVQAAISYPQQIRGLFLMAIPLKIHISYPYIKNNLVVAFSKKDRNEIISATRKRTSISTSNPFEYLGAIPRYIELLNKCKTTQELIKKLQLPIIVLQSENDEVVSNKSLYYVKGNQNIQAVIVTHAGHYYYSKENREQISYALKQFVIKVITNDTQ
jgi:carboxylesterase